MLDVRTWLAGALVVVMGGGVVAFVTLRDDGADLPTRPPAAPDTPDGTVETTTTVPASRAARTLATDPATPDDLADAIEQSEQAIGDLSTPSDEIEQWAHVQQAAYRELARRPEWDDAVAGLLDPGLRRAAAVNVAANRDLWALTDPRAELPDWRIVAPPDPETLLGYYQAAEAEFGVGWEYLAAIHLVESRMGRIRGASSAGAQGPMQFLPATWEAYGEGDINDPADAIRAAARYLTDHGAPASMPEALFAYNRSDHYVDAVEGYAEVMRNDERSYLGYYHWRVYYRLEGGDVVLPVGWETGDDPEPG